MAITAKNEWTVRPRLILALVWAVLGNSIAEAGLPNAPHHFHFSGIASPLAVTLPFNVTLRAEDVNGTLLTNFTGTVPLVALGLAGEVPLEPSMAGPFYAGRWTGAVRVTAPGRLLRLSSPATPGESNPFHAEP